MKLTREAPVFDHKVQEESALYDLSEHRLRAVYLSPYGLPCCQDKFDLRLVV